MTSAKLCLEQKQNQLLNLSNKDIFNLLNNFVGKGLQMKNSYVRYRATDFVRKYPTFKENHLDVLKVMLSNDPNTKIVEILNEFLGK